MYGIIFTGYETSGGFERVTGAHRIATSLRKQGWDIEVVDFFYHWSLDELKELIRSRHAKHKIDWLGLSCTWLVYLQPHTQQKLLDFLKFVREEYPEIKTIAGGQNHSLHFPQYEYLDWVIDGFAEVAVVEVLNSIYNKGKIKGIPRKNGWYVDANSFYKAWPISDLSVEFEDRDFMMAGETVGLEISRGCKFACAFCNFPVLGIKEDTTRDLDGLREELKRNYEKWGITNYSIADETFNDRDEKIAKLADIVETIGFELNFTAFIRADILISRPQQLELLARARVWGHYYGIETFNKETGKVIGKGLDPDRMREGLLNIKKYFLDKLGLYRGTISLIYGLPKDTKESILNSITWINENWNDQSVLAFPLNISLSGNKSKIDHDYEKYGYKFLGQEKRPKLKPLHNFFANDITIWENPNMTIYEAIDLVDKQMSEHSGRVDNWSVWGFLPLLTKEEALTLDKKGDYSFRRRGEAYKSEYIKKKLAL